MATSVGSTILSPLQKKALCPTSLGSARRSSSREATICNYDKSYRSPVVILLGWGNGSLKNLGKYSTLFEAKGFTSVSVPTSLNQLFLRPFGMAFAKARVVAKIVDDLTKDYKDRPVFLMSFSNTGSAVYYALVKSKSLLKWNIVGTIFDSAPIVPSMEASLRAADAITQGTFFPVPQLTRIATRTLVSAQMVTNRSNFQEYMQVISMCEPSTPQLVLFSKSDPISPYADILNFIKARQRKGVGVVWKMWEDSNHVDHFRTHPKDYQDVLFKFVTMCLT